MKRTIRALAVLGVASVAGGAACFTAPPRPADDIRDDARRNDSAMPDGDGGIGLDSLIAQPCVRDTFDVAASSTCGDWAHQASTGTTISRNGQLRATAMGTLGYLTCTSLGVFEYIAPIQVELHTLPVQSAAHMMMIAITEGGETFGVRVTGTGGTATVAIESNVEGQTVVAGYASTMRWWRIRRDSANVLVLEHAETGDVDWIPFANRTMPASVERLRVQLHIDFPAGVGNNDSVAFDNLDSCSN